MKPILLLHISLFLFSFILYGQEEIGGNTIKVEKVKIDTLVKTRKDLNIYIGVDLFNPIYGMFSDKKSIEAILEIQPGSYWVYVGELGVEENKYTKNQWDIESKGLYMRAGINRFIIVDDLYNPKNGFYAGIRGAFSRYEREIKEAPIRYPDSDNNQVASFPAEHVSAFWLEIPLGGRVDLFHSHFYIDFSLRPKLLIGGTKGESGVDPIVIPGFGVENAGLNFGVNWSIVYNIPIKRAP